jgi:hypothetical protein
LKKVTLLNDAKDSDGNKDGDIFRADSSNLQGAFREPYMHPTQQMNNKHIVGTLILGRQVIDVCLVVICRFAPSMGGKIIDSAQVLQMSFIPECLDFKDLFSTLFVVVQPLKQLSFFSSLPKV